MQRGQKKPLTQAELAAMAAGGNMPQPTAPPVGAMDKPAGIAAAPVEAPPAEMPMRPAAGGVSEEVAAESVMLLDDKPIGKKELDEALLILNRYRAGKARQDRRVVECEQWPSS